MRSVVEVTYLLIIIDPLERKILYSRSGDSPGLPLVKISPLVRPARELTEEIETQFGFQTLQLACLPGPDGIRYAVHEVLGAETDVVTEKSFVNLSDISEVELSLPGRLVIKTLLENRTANLGRYANIGWIYELQRRLETKEICEVRHINCGTNFCLLSAKCDGRKLWFKGVGVPNTREYAITVELSRRFPNLLPSLHLAIPEWDAWVTEDVPGVPLCETSNPAEWRRALTALATIQKDMAVDTTELIRLGALDWSSEFLLDSLESFFEEVERAMKAQTSTRAVSMKGSDLKEVKNSLISILHETKANGVSDTLIHGDIGHGNIISSPRGPVFLDWAETCIGNPFISSEYLLADLAGTQSLSDAQIMSLRAHYAEQWTDYLPASKLRSIMVTAPAIASLAYAVATWERAKCRPSIEDAWPLMRSMVRRTKRALDEAQAVHV